MKLKILAALSAMTLMLALVICAGCAPQISSETDNGERSDGLTLQTGFTWSSDSDCSICHSKESNSLVTAGFMASSHEKLTCLNCHADETVLGTIHEKVTTEDTDGAKKLKKSEVPDKTCLACHEKDYAPETTENSLLIDESGTEVNPHAMPDVDGHAEIGCADCHAAHEQKDPETAASEFCQSCHHSGTYQSCLSCHK